MIIAKALLLNRSLVHIELGCNQITSEGCEYLFEMLINQ